jgi:hypothetical protein
MPRPKPPSTPDVLSVISLIPIRVWAASRSLLLDLERAAQKGQIAAGASRDLVARGCRHAAWNSRSGRVVQRARSILKLLGEAEGEPAPIDTDADNKSRIEALHGIARRLGATIPSGRAGTATETAKS